MLPASNRGAGQSLCFPDVCLTPAPPAPPVPVPYPNIAMNCQATGFAPNVKVSGMNALNLGSRIPVTMGDEAGAAHPTKKGGGGYTMGNPVVSINKLPAINLGCPTNGNNMNAPLGAVLVPSAVNVMYCRAGAAAAGDLPVELLRELGEAASDGAACSFRMLGDGVGLVRLASLPTCAGTLFFAALRRLRNDGATRIVLDLRSNPGGDLEAAVAVASELCPPGTLVVQVELGGDLEPRRARGTEPDASPLAVLVDRGTASAAEVLAAALAASGRALLYGERTFGKDAACAVHADGSHPRYEPIARVRLPDGGSFPAGGIAPDVCCPSGEALARACADLLSAAPPPEADRAARGARSTSRGSPAT